MNDFSPVSRTTPPPPPPLPPSCRRARRRNPWLGALVPTVVILIACAGAALAIVRWSSTTPDEAIQIFSIMAGVLALPVYLVCVLCRYSKVLNIIVGVLTSMAALLIAGTIGLAVVGHQVLKHQFADGMPTIPGMQEFDLQTALQQIEQLSQAHQLTPGQSDAQELTMLEQLIANVSHQPTSEEAAQSMFGQDDAGGFDLSPISAPTTPKKRDDERSLLERARDALTTQAGETTFTLTRQGRSMHVANNALGINFMVPATNVVISPPEMTATDTTWRFHSIRPKLLISITVMEDAITTERDFALLQRGFEYTFSREAAEGNVNIQINQREASWRAGVATRSGRHGDQFFSAVLHLNRGRAKGWRGPIALCAIASDADVAERIIHNVQAEGILP